MFTVYLEKYRNVTPFWVEFGLTLGCSLPALTCCKIVDLVLIWQWGKYLINLTAMNQIPHLFLPISL